MNGPNIFQMLLVKISPSESGRRLRNGHGSSAATTSGSSGLLFRVSCHNTLLIVTAWIWKSRVPVSAALGTTQEACSLPAARLIGCLVQHLLHLSSAHFARHADASLGTPSLSSRCYGVDIKQHRRGDDCGAAGLRQVQRLLRLRRQRGC